MSYMARASSASLRAFGLSFVLAAASASASGLLFSKWLEQLEKNKISVDFSAWSPWLSQGPLKIASDLAGSPVLTNMVKEVRVKYPLVARFKASNRRSAIQWSQHAPVAATEVVDVGAKSSSEEPTLSMQQMVELYRGMRARFKVASNEKPIQIVSVAELQSVTDGKAGNIRIKNVSSYVVSKKVTRVHKARRVPVPSSISAVPEIKFGRAMDELHSSESSALLQEIQLAKEAVEHGLTARATIRDEQGFKAFAERSPQKAHAKLEAPVTLQANAAAIIVRKPHAKISIVPKVVAVSPVVEILPAAQQEEEAPRLDSVTESAQPASSLMTQSVEQPAAPVSTQQGISVYASSIGPEQLDEKAVTTHDAVLATQAHTALSTHETEANSPEFVEGFSFETAISEVEVSSITRQWRSAEKEGYLGAVSFADPGNTFSTTPLLSENTLSYLNKKFLPEVQTPSDTVVWGKIGRNLQIQLKGRMEPPRYFDAKLSEVNLEDIEGFGGDAPLYFMFLNVAPGSQYLYARDTKTLSSSAMEVLCLDGSATYLDLTKPRSGQTVRGRVLDASQQLTDGIQGIGIRVLGAGKTGTLDQGYFQVSDVLRFGDHPVIVETRSDEGPVHRYQLTNNSGNDLYWFSRDSLIALVSPFREDVRSDGGLVIAAYPHLLQQVEERQIYPKFEAISDRSRPPVPFYSLSIEGQGLYLAPLEKDTSRVIAVQVPAGPVRVSLNEELKGMFWSELIVASPGVINVVGPY